jgi:hypothetical protein
MSPLLGVLFGGGTGKAWIDVWTIAHLAFWIFVGSVLWNLKYPRDWMLVGCIASAYAWEMFERYAEKRWSDLWRNPESWGNAWLFDPLTCVLGVLFMWYALDNWRR